MRWSKHMIETKVTCRQMKVFNREMEYKTVMANYWPTGPVNNTELEE